MAFYILNSITESYIYNVHILNMCLKYQNKFSNFQTKRQKRWQNNTKMDLRKRGCERGRWVELAQDDDE